MKKKLKEVFHQSADSGIPPHWVVQYYVEGSPFPEAEYFGTEEEAWTFAETLRV